MQAPQIIAIVIMAMTFAMHMNGLANVDLKDKDKALHHIGKMLIGIPTWTALLYWGGFWS